MLKGESQQQVYNYMGQAKQRGTLEERISQSLSFNVRVKQALAYFRNKYPDNKNLKLACLATEENMRNHIFFKNLVETYDKEMEKIMN